MYHVAVPSKTLCIWTNLKKRRRRASGDSKPQPTPVRRGQASKLSFTTDELISLSRLPTAFHWAIATMTHIDVRVHETRSCVPSPPKPVPRERSLHGKNGSAILTEWHSEIVINLCRWPVTWVSQITGRGRSNVERRCFVLSGVHAHKGWEGVHLRPRSSWHPTTLVGCCLCWCVCQIFRCYWVGI